MGLKRIIKLTKLSWFHLKLLVRYRLLFWYRYLQNGFKSKIVLFYPQKPEHRNVVYKILCNLGYKITKDSRKKFDLVFNWEDTTFRKPDDVLLNLSKDNHIINLKCADISKEYIGKVFLKIFKYEIRINPEKYSGNCIKKSNFNADSKRGKEVIVCPAKLEENYSYEKIINTTNKDGFLVDFRVPIFKTTIPLVYQRVKESTEIFSDGINPKLSVEIPGRIFSEQEIQKILKFAKAIHLDCGEMDILRDNKDKKIYIVDVNTTPFGLHNVPNKFRKEALNLLSTSFKQQFF